MPSHPFSACSPSLMLSAALLTSLLSPLTLPQALCRLSRPFSAPHSPSCLLPPFSHPFSARSPSLMPAQLFSAPHSPSHPLPPFSHPFSARSPSLMPAHLFSAPHSPSRPLPPAHPSSWEYSMLYTTPSVYILLYLQVFHVRATDPHS